MNNSILEKIEQKHPTQFEEENPTTTKSKRSRIVKLGFLLISKLAIYQILTSKRINNAKLKGN